MLAKFLPSFLLLAGLALGAPPDEAYVRAARCLVAERAGEAIAAFGAAMTERPDSVEGHFQRGLEWRAKLKRVRAIDEFSAALAINPQHAPSLAARGLLQLDFRQHELALADAEAAIRADPRCAFGYFVRGKLRGMPGHYDLPSREADLTVAIALDPEFAWAYYYRGSSEDLDRAIALDRREPHFFEQRGNQRIRERRYADARREYEQAIALDPKNAYYPIERAECAYFSGDYAGALREIDEALKMNMTVYAKAFAYEVRGRALNKLGRFEPARKAFDVALRNDAARYNSLAGRAWARSRTGDHRGAVADCDQTLRLDPQNAGALQTRANALFAVADFAPAATAARAGLEIIGWEDASSPYLALVLSLSERRLDHPDAARKPLTRWAGRNWPRPLFEFLLGKISAEQLLAAAKTNDEQTEAHAYLGLLAAGEKRRDEALAQLRWVVAHGNKTFFEAAFAQAEILRLEAPATTSR